MISGSVFFRSAVDAVNSVEKSKETRRGFERLRQGVPFYGYLANLRRIQRHTMTSQRHLIQETRCQDVGCFISLNFFCRDVDR